MSLVHGLGQRIGNPGADPHHGGLLDAELHRDCIGRLETDSTDVARQAIWVFGHDLDGVRSVGAGIPTRTSWVTRPTTTQSSTRIIDDMRMHSPDVAAGYFKYIEARAKNFVEKFWYEIEAVAAALVERKTLSADEVRIAMMGAYRDRIAA